MTTAGFVALFSALERRARPAERARSLGEQVAGAVLTCGGLVFLALGGIVSGSGQGIAILPLAAVAAGIGLILHANSPAPPRGLSRR